MSGQLLGERRALSLFAIGCITTVFFLMGLSLGPDWAYCFFALSGAYGIGFFALASEWFWARWYVLGIGFNGLGVAVLGLVTGGWNIGLAIWGAIHLAIYAPLLGDSMADLYENQQQWRRRYGVDDYGVARIRRAVKSAATALPTLIIYTLAPREHNLLFVSIFLLIVLGFWGLLRMRFWGVATITVAIVGIVVSLVQSSLSLATLSGALVTSEASVGLLTLGIFSLLFLLLSISPFVIPAYHHLRQPRAEL